MTYDLAKTQFLAVAERGRYYPIKAFRRKRGHMLFNKTGEPQRRIEWSDWLQLQKDWPAEVAADGLKVKQVWFLEEIKEGA